MSGNPFDGLIVVCKYDVAKIEMSHFRYFIVEGDAVEFNRRFISTCFPGILFSDDVDVSFG